MLYCPKCSRTYEEGTQRFCTNEGARLLPTASPAAKSAAAPPKGVFSTILNQTLHSDERIGKTVPEPVSAAAEPKQNQPPPKRIFDPVVPVGEKLAPQVKPPREVKLTSSVNLSSEKENSQPEVKTTEAKPVPRLIKPNEIPISQAKLGDRAVNPTGRLALTWENTAILLGQTIKGRYYVVEQSSEDETSVAYLAEDKIVEGKKVIVRVLMDEKDQNDYLGKVFAEERVSLSHVNHPNVAALLDSGKLPEGKSFIISEYVEGESLKEKLRHSGAFNPLRAARVVRQIANALGEVHQNGILHRNLNPHYVVMSVSDAGIEQVKVTDFAVFDGFDEPSEDGIKYLAPEQLEGSLANYASDIYSLAVIAYQMLTGRLPFNFSKEKELLKAQRDGLKLLPTNLRLDLPASVDGILEKALAYKPAERFPKARDFGDALFNALSAGKPLEKPAEDVRLAELAEEKDFLPISLTAPSVTAPDPAELVTASPVEVETVSSFLRAESDSVETREILELKESETENRKAEKTEIADRREVKAASPAPNLIREKTPSQPARAGGSSKTFALALGLLLAGVAGWMLWNYFSKRPPAAPVASNPPTSAERAVSKPAEQAQPQQQSAAIPAGSAATEQKNEFPAAATDSVPPPSRKISQPPNTARFQNSKGNLKGDLAKNFRAFSFYYPNDWVKNPGGSNFVDVARIGATGTPIEQMLVGYYESKGTFSADSEKFSVLVEQSNKDLRKALDGKYAFVSQGETVINGWKAYEMKFRGEGVTKNGDKITLWGKRLWIPAARPGAGSGFVITMLATSLSPEVKSADDVGVKGELAAVLKTFEPASANAAAE